MTPIEDAAYMSTLKRRPSQLPRKSPEMRAFHKAMSTWHCSKPQPYVTKGKDFLQLRKRGN